MSGPKVRCGQIVTFELVVTSYKFSLASLPGDGKNIMNYSNTDRIVVVGF